MARYLAIPKAGSSSVREAMRFEYGLRDTSGLPWQMGKGMWHEDVSHILTKAQLSWFGWTLVADPVSHFIGGWAQANGDTAAGMHCADVPRFLELLSINANQTHNVHLAPQLLIIRSAIAQFARWPRPEWVALSFLGQLPLIATEWGMLRTAMEEAGARPFARPLPHLREPSSQAGCRAAMGVHGSAKTFPPASLRILCAYLLEDFVCLDFPFPEACLGAARSEKRNASVNFP